MPSQSEKWAARASHVLDAFVGLKARYAILDPLLFDKDVVQRWGRGHRAEGFHYLANALLHSCILDVSNIALDGDRRTPSIRNLVGALEDQTLVATLRQEYAVWNLVASSDAELDVLPLLQAAERREESERRKQFDQLLDQLRSRWADFTRSPRLTAFLTMRDKLIAHRELAFVDGKYKALDASAMGLKFGDLKSVIGELQAFVDLVTLLFRNASFDFEMLETQVRRYGEHFWAPSAG